MSIRHLLSAGLAEFLFGSIPALRAGPGVPRKHRNGGSRSGVAIAKRAARKRRNIAKRERSA